MKKLTSVFLTAMLAASLTACSQGSSGQGDDSRVINIAVIKQLDHASLDEIANAITGELDALAKANNVTIKYTVDSDNTPAVRGTVCVLRCGCHHPDRDTGCPDNDFRG